MPNDTVRADAQTMPVDRRAALSSLAAAGALLAISVHAKAIGDDADIFAAIERLKGLLRAQKAAHERVSSLNRQIPAPPAIVAERREVSRTQNVMPLFEAAGIDASHPDLGLVYSRAVEICRADAEWIRTRREAEERLEYEEADEADADADAVIGTYSAARDMLDLRPRTLAGLRALVAALADFKLFEMEPDGEGNALLKMLLASPALTLEA